MVTNISFCFWSGWLLNHTHKHSHSLGIGDRKTKKKIEGRKWDRENGEKITDIDTDLLVVTMM